MLFAALLIISSVPSIDEKSISAPESDVNLFVTTLSGVSLIQVNSRADQRGLVLGVRAGIRASRPPLVTGAARLGFLPTLALRHDFGSDRSDWTGAFSLTLDLWRFRLMNTVGYGLSSRAELAPQPVLEIGVGVGTRLGPAWICVSFDTLMRFGDGSRSMHLGLQLGFEWELVRETFD